jgi:hypothetical protein
MKQKRWSTDFFLKVVCASVLLLATAGVSACAHNSASSGTSATNGSAMNPVSQQSDASPTTAVTPGTRTTATAAVGAKGTYIGQIPSKHAWVGLSSTGQRIVAFVTDGSKEHTATFAQWFRGILSNNTVNASSERNARGALHARLTNSTASGTVTLRNGTSFPFTAQAVPPTNGTAGLYRSDRVVNGTHYVGGWIVPPSTQATATPGTPRAPGATVTATVTATAAAAVPAQGGAIINEKSNTLLPAPSLTSQDLSSRTVRDPKLGTFRLLQCRQTLC